MKDFFELRKEMLGEMLAVRDKHSKTNKATMHIKHGHDPADRENNTKYKNFVKKHSGATVKYHNNSTNDISYHGSDHQIDKALKVHHSDFNGHTTISHLKYHKQPPNKRNDDDDDGHHTYTNHG